MIIGNIVASNVIKTIHYNSILMIYTLIWINAVPDISLSIFSEEEAADEKERNETDSQKSETSSQRSVTGSQTSV